MKIERLDDEVLTAEFTDGKLSMDQYGNMCASGEMAHKYYHALKQYERQGKDVRTVFKKFLNCTVIL